MKPPTKPAAGVVNTGSDLLANAMNRHLLGITIYDADDRQVAGWVPLRTVRRNLLAVAFERPDHRPSRALSVRYDAAAHTLAVERSYHEPPPHYAETYRAVDVFDVATRAVALLAASPVVWPDGAAFTGECFSAPSSVATARRTP